MGEAFAANRIRLCDAIRTLRDDDNFLDISLTVNDDDGHFVFRAHRLVLAAASPIFKTLLAQLRGPDPVIFMNDIRKRDLGHILDYIYDGEVAVTEGERDSFLSAAKDLKILGLEDVDAEQWEENMMSPPPPPPAKRFKSSRDLAAVKCEPSTSAAAYAADMQQAQAQGEEGEWKPDTVGGGGGSQSSLQEMMENNMATLANGFMCRICGSVVKSRRSLFNHFRDQHYNTNVRYSCPVCKGVYKSRNSFGVHICTKHRELKGLDFELCVLKE